MTAPTTTPAPATSATVRGDRASATLLVAFSADPIVRWFWPDPADYLDGYPALLDLFGIRAPSTATLDLLTDDVGAALWFPPGVEVDGDGVGALFEASVHPDRHADGFVMLEQMNEHHLSEPHWYLPFVGVDPSRQGRGHGSTLLRQGLARCDLDGLPAYLEASSPRNRGLYERHGFETSAEIRVGDSPPLWPMVRPAR